MSKKSKKIKWKIKTESIYRFGREERVQSAYEKILPIEKVNMTRRGNALCQNWTLCESVE